MRFAFFFFISAVSLNSQSQDFPRKDIDPSPLADEIFASQELDINYQDLYENYLQMISNPMDLNSVTGEQLSALYFLKREQIQSILNYRNEAGLFISVYELQIILDSNTFYKIIPFV